MWRNICRVRADIVVIDATTPKQAIAEIPRSLLARPAAGVPPRRTLTSLAAIGRTTLSASGGALADAVGWSPFFVIATAACLPGLALLVWVMRLEGAGER